MAGKKKVKPARKSVSKETAFTPADEAEAIKGSPLTELEDLFAIAYTGRARYNATKAARLIGLSEKAPHNAGYEMRHRPWVAKRIDILKQRQIDELRLSPEELEAELGAIIRADYRNMFAANGRIMEPEEVDDYTARAVIGVKVREEFAKVGNENMHVADVIEVKFADKNTAIANYMRSLGMFKDTVVVDPSEPLKRILEKIDGNSVGPPALRQGT